MSKMISVEFIKERIFWIRGRKVMLDKDLAELYEVSTKRLNEQVKRNVGRFPKDFMFQLSKKEKDQLVANCDHLRNLKFSYQLPNVFTEQGVAMLSSVLNSERAIHVNIITKFPRLLRRYLVPHCLYQIDKFGEVLTTIKNLEKVSADHAGFCSDARDDLGS